MHDAQKILTKVKFVWYNSCVGRPVRLLVFIGVLKWEDETEVNGVKHVIHIFGASGSGTSTLGREIAAGLGYRFMDTDDYFWLPTDPKYTHKRPVSERLALMRRDIEEADSVVISGSLVDWGDELIHLFTLAIRLRTETGLRIQRLKKRERAAFGSRLDVGGDMYQIHQDFLEWAAAYDTGGTDMRSSARHDVWQELLHCEVLHLNGGDALEKNFRIVKEVLDKGCSGQ